MPPVLRSLSRIALLSSITLCALAQNSTQNVASHSTGGPKLELARLPLAFEQNTGQAAAGTDFLVHSGEMQAEISAAQVRLSLPPAQGQQEQVAIRLEGARESAEARPADRLPGESNYLIGKNVTDWRLHVPQYGRVGYSEVYRGIDLTYYGNGSRMEHDFVVHPGADPSQIHLNLDGARSVQVGNAGDLRIALQSGAITLQRPRAYQTIDGRQRDVPAGFVVQGTRVRFRLGSYDRSRELVIDPVLDYSTFLANGSISVAGVATDAAGDTYVTGEAAVTYPATANSATCISCVSSTKSAVFVTKLNPTGTAAIYSTFLGGSTDPYNSASSDQASGLTVDANGDAIVAGWTSSTDFPLKNPISAGTPSFDDGFLVSLTPDGSGFNFSSRLGGSSSGSTSASVFPESLATDSSGDVYVAGTSESSFLPVTSGALNGCSPTYGNTCGFLLKLSPAGALVYGAVVGPVGSVSGGAGPKGLAVDSTGVVYMAGTTGVNLTTNAPLWPTTSGAYQTTLISPSDGAPFVTRISADGSTILSSTLVGSGSVAAMALTPSHDVLIAGSADYNFPVTADAYQSNAPTSVNGTITSGADAFIAKVSQDGTQLLYSSVFGPAATNLFIDAVQEDANGNVWIGGTTDGALTTLVHPLQSVYGGFPGGVGFVAEFDPPMHNLLFSTYVNGTTGNSQLSGLAIDPGGLVHVAGTASQSFPTTPGVFLSAVDSPPPNYYYAYGFAAVMDVSKPGGSVCFANARGATAEIGSSANSSFDIVNCGDGPLTISSTQLTSSVFAFASANTCTGTLAVGSSCTLSYTFTPKAMGSTTATVTIASDAPMAANAETIWGFGTAPVVYLIGSSATFPPMVLGTTAQPVVLFVVNKGTAPLIVDTARTAATSPFSITSTTCSSPVAPSSACTFTMAFTPTAAGNATGTLTIYTNDPATPSVTVSLNASALASYPVPTITSLSAPTLSLDGGPANVRILGTNFFPATTVQINGVAYPVTVESNMALTVSVDPSKFGTFGEFPVQVSNPSPGGASNTATLTTYHLLNLTATNIVYEPHSGLLYAAIPAASSANPNTILPINPATGAFGTPIPVQANPTRLAVSDNGHYLYVGFYYTYSSSASLQRIDLTTGAVDRTFALPGSSDGIMDMHVVPGSPQLLVASLGRSASPSENGVALFNDSGLVQYISNDYSDGYYSLDNFTFTSDPTTYYGYPANSSFFNTATVSSTGIKPVSFSPYGTCCIQSSGSIMVSDGTLLYTNSGQVWDPKAKTLLGTYSGGMFFEPAIVADPAAKRTFILENDYSGSGGSLYPAVGSYNPSNFTAAGQLYFALTSDTPTSLARWGVDGFAFLNGMTTSGSFTAPNSTSQLVLFRSSLATPGPVTISPASLNFGLQTVGVSSASQTVTILNSGSAVLTDLAISVTGTNAGSFSANSACTASLAPGSSCTVTVVFSPSTTGSAQATLQIADSATGSPQTVALTGSAAVPSYTVSSHSLSFTSLPEGSSAQQTVTITNSGAVALTGFTTAVSGTNAADFTTSSNCGGSIAAGANCTATVTFKPSTTADESATLTLSASGAGSQTVALSGTGTAPDFVLPPPSGSSTATVPAGQPASFKLNVSEAGTFSGTVTMSCSNLPTYAACNFSPSSFTLGPTPATVTLSISTEQTVQAQLRPESDGRNGPSHPIEWAMLLLALPAASRRLRGRLRGGRLLIWMLVIGAGAFALNGCSGGSAGGSGGGTGPTVEKTPPGSYTVTVTATSANVSHSTNVTLVVQ